MIDPSMYPLLIFIAVVLIAVALFLPFANDFVREARYLNSEIGRTTGEERRYWVRRRRRLWLSLLPFFKY